MHYIKSKTILSKNNGFNLYRGCSHGCIYCDSRSECYNMNHEFEDIAIKENGLSLLKKELLKKKEKTMIGIGAMSDPYIPLEKKLKYTQKAIQIINRYNFGFTLITKSNLILRDINLLKEINEKNKAVIQITMTTFDDKLTKIIEPNAPSTKKRFKVLKKLNNENIPTIVWLCPILPFINDNEENINGIIDYCIDANVKGILCFNMGLTLREGNREYFYKKLDENFPGLKKEYIKKYKNNYSLNSPKNKKLLDIFYQKTSANNIMNNDKEIFNYLHYLKEKTIQTTLSF